MSPSTQPLDEPLASEGPALPPAPPEPTPDLPPGYVEHTVVRGEVLAEIARRYGVPIATLGAANPQLHDPHRLRVGQVLAVPVGDGFGRVPRRHEVRRGDTLSELAAQHHLHPRTLWMANRHLLPDPHRLRVPALWVPGRPPASVAPAGRCEPIEEPRAEPAVRDELLPVAQFVRAPLAAPLELGRPQRAVAEALRRIEDQRQALDDDQTLQLLLAVLPAFEAYDLRCEAAGLGTVFEATGVRRLMHLVDRLPDTAPGQQAVERFARLGAWQTDAVSQAMAEGASPRLAMAFARQPGIDTQRVLSVVLGGISRFREHLAGQAMAYARHTHELGWLVGQVGPVMTGDQLQAASTDYLASRDAAWHAETERLKSTLAADGAAALKQLRALIELPPELASYQASVATLIRETLEDPRAQLAIGTALRERPELLVGRMGRQFLAFFADAQYVSTAKITDQARKLIGEVTTAYVRANVIAQARVLGADDTHAVSRMREAVEALRDWRFAALLGVPTSKLHAALDAVAELEGAVLPEETAHRIGRFQIRLDELKGFDKSTLPGQLLRVVGLSLTGAAFTAAAAKAGVDAPLQDNAKALLYGAGLVQKGSELALGLGKVEKQSLVGRLGGTAAGKALGAATSVFDFHEAGKAALAGDPVASALYGLGGAGGLAAAFGSGSTLGPIGVLGVVGAVFGLGAWRQVQDAHRHEPSRDGGASLRFLRHAGLSEAAARDLLRQSGDGHSILPLVARHAALSGFDLARPDHQARLMRWLDEMRPASREALCQGLRRGADAIGGDAGRFEATGPDDEAVQQARRESPWELGTGLIPLRSHAQVESALRILRVPALVP